MVGSTTATHALLPLAAAGAAGSPLDGNSGTRRPHQLSHGGSGGGGGGGRILQKTAGHLLDPLPLSMQGLPDPSAVTGVQPLPPNLGVPAIVFPSPSTTTTKTGSAVRGPVTAAHAAAAAAAAAAAQAAAAQAAAYNANARAVRTRGARAASAAIEAAATHLAPGPSSSPSTTTTTTPSSDPFDNLFTKVQQQLTAAHGAPPPPTLRMPEISLPTKTSPNGGLKTGKAGGATPSPPAKAAANNSSNNNHGSHFTPTAKSSSSTPKLDDVSAAAAAIAARAIADINSTKSAGLDGKTGAAKRGRPLKTKPNAAAPPTPTTVLDNWLTTGTKTTGKVESPAHATSPTSPSKKKPPLTNGAATSPSSAMPRPPAAAPTLKPKVKGGMKPGSSLVKTAVKVDRRLEQAAEGSGIATAAEHAAVAAAAAAVVAAVTGTGDKSSGAPSAAVKAAARPPVKRPPPKRPSVFTATRTQTAQQQQQSQGGDASAFRRRSRAALMAARSAASLEEQWQKEAAAAMVTSGLETDPATLEDLRDLLGVRALPTKSEPAPEEKLVELQAALKALNETTRAWDAKQSGVFLNPVDTKIAPNYYTVIHNPIDLSTIGQKIESGVYASAWDYMDDMRLMFQNAFVFNRVGSFHHRYALRMQAWWLVRVEQMMLETLANHRYCCGKHRLLSAEVYRCRGGTCFVQHDQLYFAYQLEGDERIIYCQSHFAKLEETFTLPRYSAGSGSDEELVLHKSDFVRMKHNEPLTPERFIFCQLCGRKDHEICVLHIGYDGKEYVCGSCRLKQDPSLPDRFLLAVQNGCHCRVNGVMQKNLLAPSPAQLEALTKAAQVRAAAVSAAASAAAAAALKAPSTAAPPPPPPPAVAAVRAPPAVAVKSTGTMTIRMVAPRQTPAVAAVEPTTPTGAAPESGQEPLTWTPQPNACDCKFPIPVSPYRAADLPDTILAQALRKELEAAEPEAAKHIVVRTVCHTRDNAETKELMRSWFPDYVLQFPYTRKTLLAFYDLGDADICFFAVIVHEYGADCPEPNQNRVYISLLDSVKLPKMLLASKVRTHVYHTMLRGYLRYCAGRGFTHAHIFTCPPRRGQNYIFPFKPDYQREISVTRLRQWYDDMLHGCMYRHDPAALDVMSIPEAFPNVTMTELPYFDGDNWPDIMEDILRLEETQNSEGSQRETVARMVARACLMLWEAWKNGPQPKYSKPPDAGGYYQGFPPANLASRPPRKRRKTELRTHDVNDRLNTILRNTHRDFLVVKLMPLAAGPVPDPDDLSGIATTGDEVSIASFLKAERLEFSTLRHSRFSTAAMLYLLLSPKKEFVTRWPEANRGTDSVERKDTAMTNSPEKAQGSSVTTGGSSAIMPQGLSTAASPDAVTQGSPLSELVHADSSMMDDGEPAAKDDELRENGVKEEDGEKEEDAGDAGDVGDVGDGAEQREEQEQEDDDDDMKAEVATPAGAEGEGGAAAAPMEGVEGEGAKAEGQGAEVMQTQE